MIWFDGALVSAVQARVDPFDRGLLLGDGVFETIRALHRRPLHLSRHLARLHDGAAVLGIEVPWDDAALACGIAGVLEDDAATQPMVVRLTVTRGAGPGRGLLPAPDLRATVLITAEPLPAPAGPARVIVATCTRRHDLSPLSRIKSLNYLDSILARREAAAAGAHDAILLNTRGLVAEATAGTVFVVQDGEVSTPPVEDGALPGIARALLLERGLAVQRSLTPAVLRACDAAFITNSLGLRVLASIDGALVRPPEPALLDLLRTALDDGSYPSLP